MPEEVTATEESPPAEEVTATEESAIVTDDVPMAAPPEIGSGDSIEKSADQALEEDDLQQAPSKGDCGGGGCSSSAGPSPALYSAPASAAPTGTLLMLLLILWTVRTTRSRSEGPKKRDEPQLA